MLVIAIHVHQRPSDTHWVVCKHTYPWVLDGLTAHTPVGYVLQPRGKTLFLLDQGWITMMTKVWSSMVLLVHLCHNNALAKVHLH